MQINVLFRCDSQNKVKKNKRGFKLNATDIKLLTENNVVDLKIA